ncbi:uracil-xanthine permease [Klebsiella pneumoniae subsp. ozaenae]|uniref:Uracil-xanthine permease n=1 Tax=Klebsiella pneumoniae subsp. ozaenae TaxID=574 RepID=A0A377ZQF3_KLEPO|nr:uracil-xanthine permease [Klebsiella pneumoniae subsp. ozaenae]
MLFGVNFVAALVPVIVSRFIEPLKKIFTPIHYRQRDCADRHQPDQGQRHQLVRWGKGRGFRQHEQYRARGGHPRVIVLLSCAKNRWLRLSSVVVGIAVGCIAAGLSGPVPSSTAWATPCFACRRCFRSAFQFNRRDISAGRPGVAGLYSGGGGDLTANSLISQQSVDDCAFRNRLKGGILADGVSCMVAAMLCAFPNTTFAQNNGVIQMTGVASRLCRTLHWRDSDPARAVSPGGRTAAADPGAGAGGRHRW